MAKPTPKPLLWLLLMVGLLTITSSGLEVVDGEASPFRLVLFGVTVAYTLVVIGLLVWRYREPQ